MDRARLLERAGRLRCSPDGTPQTCGEDGAWRDEAACPEMQVCIPETGRCGQCSEGDKRFCIRELRGVNTTADEENPWVSPDELFIVFDSNRPGGAGDKDLWLSRRATARSDFGAPVNLGELNTVASEEGATLTRDGSTIFFASSRPGGGGGGLDIWFAARRDPNGTFATPRPLTSLNAGGLDLDLALSPDGDELFFSSQRGGGVQQIYRAVRSCD